MGSNSQRSVIINTTKNDVKHKISKLEDDSRRLCLRLRNLQKHRANLTNEAVALSQELEGSTIRSYQAEEAKHFEPDCIRVLLEAKHLQENTDPCDISEKFPYEESLKNDCCTICTCSECEGYSEVAEENMENELEKSLMKTTSTEETEGHERCCICCRSDNTIPTYIDKIVTKTVSRVDDDLNSIESEQKVNFCSTCSMEGESCNGRCKICICQQDDEKTSVLNYSHCTASEVEKRCRGGVDRVEVKTERKKRVCEGCECNLCALRNVEGPSPPCQMTLESCGRSSDCNDEFVISSGDAPAKLQQMCKVEKLREVLEQLKNRNHALRKMLNDCDCVSESSVNFLAPEKSSSETAASDLIGESTSSLIARVKLLQSKCRTKDGMILALAEALKKLSSPDQTERILKKLTNPCSVDSPIRDLDRSELWRYLRAKESPQKRMQRDERESLEIVRQDESEEENPTEETSKCRCATYTQVSPPRDLRIVERIGADTLVITWQPPESGPIKAYEIFVDEELVARLQTPLRRTEAVLRSLDLTSSRLIEVLAIDPTGFGSSSIERLYDPTRFDRSKAH